MFRCTLCLEMISFYAVFIILISAFMVKASDETDFIKPKRAYAGVSGLTPFPRTGRSDPELSNWDSAYNTFEEYEDYPHVEVKRQGLVAFPRVGRAGSNNRYLSRSALQDMIKRGVPAAGNGMWFGPRLGRIQKREAHDSMQELHAKYDYSPRLGRDSSSENLDDFTIYFAGTTTDRDNLMKLFN